jgi:succinate dehydrogenase hydrophobic membrane anchor protein/succinate dehydrogenase cytochrome b556 subunit
MMISSAAERYPRTSYLRNLYRIKGWPYVAAWAHRASGVLLAGYLLFHVVTLASLRNPAAFESKMQAFAALFPVFFEWLLAVPVIYHALNGGRLLLYEVYGNRRDRTVLNWVLVLSGCYLLLLGIFMALGNQGVSPIFFWSYLLLSSALITYVTISRLRISGASLPWKLQRISAAFLLLMIPAHMLFMHLDPAIGRDAQLIIARMSNQFIKLVDLLLLVGVMFHGAYGVRGICLDYLSSPRARMVCTVVIVLVSVYFTWLGVQMIVSI